jgi:hypothetical protein
MTEDIALNREYKLHLNCDSFKSDMATFLTEKFKMQDLQKLMVNV